MAGINRHLISAEEELDRIEYYYKRSFSEIQALFPMTQAYLISILYVGKAICETMGMEFKDAHDIEVLKSLTYNSSDYPIEFFEALLKADENNIRQYIPILLGVKDLFIKNQKEIIRLLRDDSVIHNPLLDITEIN